MAEGNISHHVQTLQNVKRELIRVREHLKGLNAQKKNAEEKIMAYLVESEKPGVKYNDFVVLSDERLKRKRKTAKEKEKDSVEVLEKHGVEDAGRVYRELVEAMRGEKEMVSVVKTKDLIIA